MKITVSKISLLIIAGLILFPVAAYAEIDIRYTDDGFKIKTNEKWIKFGGTLMWDVDSASGEFWDSEENQNDWQTNSELRRARLNIRTRLADNWKAKLQFDYERDDASIEINDAYLKYTGWEYASVIIGQAKEPFGFEAMTSSKNLSFIEHSMVTKAIVPGRSLGISLEGNDDFLIWQTGIYEALDREDEGDTYAVTGHLAVSPWKTDTGFLHLGVSGSYRDYDGEEFEIKESAEIHTADNIVFSDEIDTDYLLLYGFETVFSKGPFSLSAEYMMADVNAVDKEDDAAFDGYYLNASWFLTGETKPFKKGIWTRLKPESAYGAWELVTRYSYLDAADNNFGATADTYTLGVNWHINSNIRLMTDYMHLCLTDEETDKKNTGDAVSFRVQCVF